MANNLGTTTVAYTLTEGQSNNRPRFFSVKNYAYWKERIRIFIQSIDYNIWKIVVSGPKIPTKTSADGVVTPKEEAEWNEDDKKKIELNAKAINLLHCAISFEEYRKVSRCKTAKEIWEKLQVTHEGTKQVKETRIDMLRKEYEMFSMKDGESIDEAFERFSIIINNLDAMGTNYAEQTLVRKLLRSLTKEWENTATVLTESNNISPITYDELRGKLLAYEATHANTYSKKKGIALKSQIEPKESESSDGISDDELLFFARRFRRMMKNKSKYKGSSSKEHKIDLSKVMCHHCKEAGHFKLNCPKLIKEDKGKKERKRVLMAAWEDLENDSNEEEESEGDDKDCFMAGNNNLDEVNYYDLTIEDLHVIIDDLTLNTSKLLDKYNGCRSERDVLRAENNFLKEKVKETECALDIIEENRFLKSELDKLKGKHIVDPSQELFAKSPFNLLIVSFSLSFSAISS